MRSSAGKASALVRSFRDGKFRLCPAYGRSSTTLPSACALLSTQAATADKKLQAEDTPTKKLNFFSAINEALHIALESDPRCVRPTLVSTSCSSLLVYFESFSTCCHPPAMSTHTLVDVVTLHRSFGLRRTWNSGLQAQKFQCITYFPNFLGAGVVDFCNPIPSDKEVDKDDQQS